MKGKIANTLRIAILSLILSATIGYSLADWAPPTSAPPFNNTPPPINVGAASQTRDGNLFLMQRLFANTGIFSGVTIGGPSLPAEKLDVIGNIRATGKIRSASTVAGDSGTTVTTKDYVDNLSAGMVGMKSYQVIDAGNWDTYTANHVGLVEITFSGCVHQPGFGSIGWAFYVNGSVVNQGGPATVDYQVGWCPTYTHFMNATGNFTVTAGYWGPMPLGTQIIIKKY